MDTPPLVITVIRKQKVPLMCTLGDQLIGWLKVIVLDKERRAIDEYTFIQLGKSWPNEPLARPLVFVLTKKLF